MRRFLVLAALLVALPAGAVTIDWVEVGNPGNPADTASNCYGANCGSVANTYYISKYEVSNAQYAEFLNAKAAADPLGLYSDFMGTDITAGGITRAGASGSYTYAAKPGWESKPVTFFSFYDALRFTNWLSNGQGNGSTETGAYTLLGGTATPSNGLTVVRDPGAITFLPTENEWYKAAYYSPGGVYFDYPTGTNTQTSCVLPGSDTGNSANCWPATFPIGVVTDVGAYGLSESPYGTFDQLGNVKEWTETIPFAAVRTVRGGSFLEPAIDSSSPDWYPPAHESDTGFRVASLVPEPGTGLLVMTGLLGLAARRKRRG